ncbi:MAG: glutaminyl-peptide cyclotransferase [Gemmatimonadetes bacterium]|nr:glutaminyl-peptide cyclotransferase [Gemmatimonadota bacterium]
MGGCEPAREAADIEILRVLPHDTAAYTQGLVFHEGRLYESTGEYGESTVRELDIETGQVLRKVELEDSYFGEGLDRVGNRLVQISWKEGVAFVYDLETFRVEGSFTYEGDGWGLCYDGESLYMTSGGSILYRRDPVTFQLLDTRQILRDGRSLSEVNELECVGDYILGNVYMTDKIVRIEKATGRVVEEIDGSGLVPPGGRPRSVDSVLNGIAYDPQRGVYYLTGKRWSALFEVRIVPRP